MFGTRVCARCGKEFKRRVFGLNLGLRRRERCPHCGKWNTFDIHDNNVEILEGAKDQTPTSDLDRSESMSEEERLERRIERSRYE